LVFSCVCCFNNRLQHSVIYRKGGATWGRQHCDVCFLLLKWNVIFQSVCMFQHLALAYLLSCQYRVNTTAFESWQYEGSKEHITYIWLNKNCPWVRFLLDGFRDYKHQSKKIGTTLYICVFLNVRDAASKTVLHNDVLILKFL
jgi:hypothetical protein